MFKSKRVKELEAKLRLTELKLRNTELRLQIKEDEIALMSSPKYLQLANKKVTIKLEDINELQT